MVNGDMSALQDAQAVLQEAGITTETRLLEDESVTGALCRYADAHDIDLTVMGPAGTPGYGDSLLAATPRKCCLKAVSPC